MCETPKKFRQCSPPRSCPRPCGSSLNTTHIPHIYVELVPRSHLHRGSKFGEQVHFFLPPSLFPQNHLTPPLLIPSFDPPTSLLKPISEFTSGRKYRRSSLIKTHVRMTSKQPSVPTSIPSSSIIFNEIGRFWASWGGNRQNDTNRRIETVASRDAFFSTLFTWFPGRWNPDVILKVLYSQMGEGRSESREEGACV